jgi:hypothetical protein
VTEQEPGERTEGWFDSSRPAPVVARIAGDALPITQSRAGRVGSGRARHPGCGVRPAAYQ